MGFLVYKQIYCKFLGVNHLQFRENNIKGKNYCFLCRAGGPLFGWSKCEVCPLIKIKKCIIYLLEKLDYSYAIKPRYASIDVFYKQ